MTWLLVLSTTALLIKCALFFHHDVRNKPFLFLFVTSFFLLNILDLIGLSQLSGNGAWLLWSLKLYYSILVFCAFYLLLLSSAVSQSLTWLNSRVTLVAIVAFASMSFWGDIILVGVTRLENGSFTRIAGEYYFIDQIYMLGVLLLTLGLLIRRLIQPNDYYLKARCLVTLLSFMPSILVIMVVIVLMQLGYHVNVAGILSFTNCFMLLTFIPLSNQQKLFQTMKFVPFTRERRNDAKMQRLIKQCYNPFLGIQINMDALLKEMETVANESANIYNSVEKHRHSTKPNRG